MTDLVGSEALPFVFKDIIVCQDLLPYFEVLLHIFHTRHPALSTRIQFLFDPDDFSLVLKIKMHAPVINLVGLFPGHNP